MQSKVLRFFILIVLLASTNIMHAQKFILNKQHNGFEADDGKNYLTIEIRDSASFDSYISSIYSTLAESYPQATIQVIGNRIVRMDATSLGISLSLEPMLHVFVEFAITIEIKDHMDPHLWKNSTGAIHSQIISDNPCIRISAPIVKKLITYNPYYHSEVKVYVTKEKEIFNILSSKPPYQEKCIADDFTSEIYNYIYHNLFAELNQNFYRTWENGEHFDFMCRKWKRK